MRRPRVARPRPLPLTIALLAVAVLAALASPPAVASDAPLPLHQGVDLQRYAGQWFEIATVPTRFTKDCVGMTVVYTPRADGRTIDMLSRCRQGGFDGAIRTRDSVGIATDPANANHWRVTFVWPIKLDYKILEVGPDYEYALVGLPNRWNLWIISRTPSLDEAVYERLRERARALGFDPDRLVRTPQPLQVAGWQRELAAAR